MTKPAVSRAPRPGPAGQGATAATNGAQAQGPPTAREVQRWNGDWRMRMTMVPSFLLSALATPLGAACVLACATATCTSAVALASGASRAMFPAGHPPFFLPPLMFCLAWACCCVSLACVGTLENSKGDVIGVPKSVLDDKKFRDG